MNIQELQDWIQTHFVGWGKNQKPLYDSGWVLSTNPLIFNHNLQKLPLQWSFMGALDANGTDPVPMLLGYCQIGGVIYGIGERDISTTQIDVTLSPAGYANHQPTATWYVPNTHYIRCMIWAVEE